MKLLENPNHQELHDFIIARTFATRVPAFLATHGEAIKAPNVLTQLEKLSKNTPNVMEAYERLAISFIQMAWGQLSTSAR